MEAEVLNPQIMADVNGNNNIANPELEVIKLQELVRKLEKQNEQLRTRANAVNNCTNGPLLTTSLDYLHGSTSCSSVSFSGNYSMPSPTQLHSCALGPYATSEEPFPYFQPNSLSNDAAFENNVHTGPTVLDDVDILDLNIVLPVGESDSWLYVSPKARLQGQRAALLTPLQWCRQVLDHPGPEVELAKRTLCHRLEQAKRWRRVPSVRPYSCIEGLSSYPVLPYTKPTALSESPASFCSSSQAALQQTLPGRVSGGLTDRAPTFVSHSTLHTVSGRHAAVSPQSVVDTEPSQGVSKPEDDSISMSYKLQDMTDVQVMARLQEESLRQEYATTSATACRRSSSFSLHSLRRGEMDLEEEDEEDEEDGYDQLPPPQPRMFRAGSMQRGGLPHSHTFSSIRECRRSPSSPQYTLSGLSQYQQYSGPASLTTDTHSGYRQSADKLRRSMPNLLRAPSMPCVPSVQTLASSVSQSLASSPVSQSNGPSSLPMMSSLRNSLSFDSSNGLSRLLSSIPSPGQLSQRVQSVGNFPTMPRHPLKATAYVSPTMQQGPPSIPLSFSVSLHSIPSSTALPQPLKPGNSSVPQPLKVTAGQPTAPRSGLPRPASFIGTSGTARPSKIAQPSRSLLTPPKSVAALSALRDGSWKDGCY